VAEFSGACGERVFHSQSEVGFGDPYMEEILTLEKPQKQNNFIFANPNTNLTGMATSVQLNW